MVSYLQIEGLTKRFGATLMYQNVSMELSEGQRVAIVAKNGAGKTTLLNIIAGKEQKSSESLSTKSFFQKPPCKARRFYVIIYSEHQNFFRLYVIIYMRNYTIKHTFLYRKPWF